MTKAKARSGRDKFAKNEKIAGEYENPGPSMIDPDAHAIARGLSQLFKREKTGIVTNWLPPWAKRAKLKAFSFYFFEDKFAVDFFNRDREEMDALADDLTAEQRQQIASKIVLCAEHGIAYLSLGPDDELDLTQIAAKVGKTTFKRGSKTVRAGAGASGDGITEEGD